MAMALSIVGCGVKGRPLPPLEPKPLGLGRPSRAVLPTNSDSVQTEQNTEKAIDQSDEELSRKRR